MRILRNTLCTMCSRTERYGLLDSEFWTPEIKETQRNERLVNRMLPFWHRSEVGVGPIAHRFSIIQWSGSGNMDELKGARAQQWVTISYFWLCDFVLKFLGSRSFSVSRRMWTRGHGGIDVWLEDIARRVTRGRWRVVDDVQEANRVADAFGVCVCRCNCVCVCVCKNRAGIRGRSVTEPNAAHYCICQQTERRLGQLCCP